MADTTTVMALPFPEGADANDVPADMQALAERLDEAPGIESLTSAEIAALTAGQKPAGRVVYNSTTSKLQVSNGTSFANIDAAALLLAGGTMAGNIAMGSNKVTGLAAATTAGDAVRYEQALLLAGGTMSGNIAMGGNKVTGLAAASANGDAVRYEQVVATYAEMERPSGTQSIPNGPTTVTYSTEVDPAGIANTGTGQLSLTAGVWALSYFATTVDPVNHYLYAGTRTVDFDYGNINGLNATVYLSGATTIRAEMVNSGSTTTASLARLTAVRIGI